MEFLPVVGWIISAAAILTVGFLTHSHWIWMAGTGSGVEACAGLCELAAHHG